MALRMTISDKLCKCLDKLWADEELFDFTVQINDVSFKCYRVILGACSPFFLGLLRSGMKEANEGRVVLQDISAFIFQLILKIIYTREDMLSLDNFIEIWHSVDMLQIGFLVELCETFATKNIKLKNFSEIFSTANLFTSKLVLSSVKTFMIQNIEAIYTDTLSLELSFDEMCFIVSSHALHFSTEYKHVVTVSETPIDVTHNDKESNRSEREVSVQSDSLCCSSKTTSSENVSRDRFDKLDILLSQVRTCIISPELLMNVLEHRLIKRNGKARQIIASAIVNQTSFHHGQWPTAGIFRPFHEYGNFCVTSMNGKGKFMLIDPLDEKRYTLTSCPRLCRNIQLVSFDKELYATGGKFVNQITRNMFVYRDKSWTHVVEIPGTSILLASNGQYIYATSVFEKVIYRINPKCNPTNMISFTDLPAACFAMNVMSYQMYLLFFNGFDETEIHMLDIQAKSWTRLDNLDGPAKEIISFRNDENHFVLQTNGNLWTLKETSENIRFTRVAKLWNFDNVLYGAIFYREKLVIFYKYLEHWLKDTFVHKVDNVFHSVSYYKYHLPVQN
ncbi:kelch-like protein 41 [Physella acuta]|uniref:kelch-like protein 41 n=1 Tax=Physella acuta TaxID=109671 RepID=UPI0027DD77B9|nr:kelch-like protein 41 [Physella acuta]